MLVERTTFQAKYGKSDALIDLIRTFAKEFAPRAGIPVPKVYTDLTGTMFQVIWDQEYRDAADHAEGAKKREAMFSDPAWQQWFAKMEPLVESGDRRLLNVVPL